VSKSATSRRFVALSEEQLLQWLSRSLGAYFSPSWTALQADRGRRFKLIVDAVSA